MAEEVVGNEGSMANCRSTDYDTTSTTDTTAENQNIQKLLKQKLIINDKLSPQFKTFYDTFEQNIDFIIQYEYNILPQQKSYQTFGGAATAEDPGNSNQRARELMLKKKFDNLIKNSQKSCKSFTGPHSVL